MIMDSQDRVVPYCQSLRQGQRGQKAMNVLSHKLIKGTVSTNRCNFLDTD